MDLLALGVGEFGSGHGWFWGWGYNAGMSDAAPKRRQFQFGLRTLAVFVTAICVAMALLKAGRLDLAVGMVFPFAVGLAIGAMVPPPHSLWVAAITAPFAVSFSLMAVSALFGDLPILQVPLAGFYLGGFLLVLGGPAFAAVVGSVISRKLSHAAVSDDRRFD